VALNFDAKLTLDVTQFLASVKRAENAVDGLRKKLADPMRMPGATGSPSGVQGRQRASGAEEMANDVVRNSARARYALYDVAAAYQQVEKIATAALKAMIGTAADYERAFVNVARTTEFQSIKIGEAARAMKYSLTELATQIPVSFGKITEIATIGNQLGIAQGKLTSFTKAVAQFSSVTGVGVESAALSFGRIGELLSSAGSEVDYNQLGSAIAYTGVKAVATEAQILSVTKEIATTAKMAKFSTPDVVGLATALSSLGIAPEAARGSIIRTFALINQAVGEGGAKLQGYASVAKMSGEDFSAAWKENGQVAFNSFVSGLQSLSDSGQNLDTVLRNLGIQNVRDIQTIQKLGDNYDVYAESIANANKGYTEAIFLSQAYAQIQETVTSKIEILQNQWNNFLASAGDASFPGVKVLLDVIGGILDRLNSFARNPFGKVVITMTTAALALAAAIAAINAVVFIARATMMAYATSIEAGVIATESQTVATAQLGAVTTATTTSINKGRLAFEALKVAGKATLWLAGIYLAIEAVGALGDAFQKATNSSEYFARKAEETIGGFDGLQDAITADYGDALKKYGDDAAVGAAIASGAIIGMTATVEQNSDAARRASEIARGYAVILGGEVVDGVNSASNAIGEQNIVLGSNYDAWLRSKMLSSGAFKDFAADTETVNQLNAIGFSFNDANNAAKQGEKSLKQYYATLIEKAKASGVSSAITGDLTIKLGGLAAAGFGANTAFNNFNQTLLGTAAEALLLGNTVQTTAEKLAALGDAPEKFIEQTKTLAKARTIWDYIAEIQTKLKTAFEWRYAAKNAADVLHTAWKKVAEDFKQAARNLRELRNEMYTLYADRAVLEYQLTVANRYGDTVRAQLIQAALNNNQSQIIQNTKDQTSATQDASRALKGNSEAAIRNRQTIQGLVTSSLDWLTTLKTTSKDTKTLTNAAKTAKQDFVDQAVALGFNADQLKTYTTSFDDFISIVNGTSDKLDVSMDVYLGFDGADAALHRWKQENADLTVKVKLLNPDWATWDAAQKHIIVVGTMTDFELNRYHQAKARNATLKGRYGTSDPEATKYIQDFEKTYGTGFASGGRVSGAGSGTSDSIPAMLSNGEYVVRAGAVKAVGVGTMDRINQADRMNFADGGLVKGYKDGGPAKKDGTPVDIFFDPMGWISQLVSSMYGNGGNPAPYLNASAGSGMKGAAGNTLQAYKDWVFNPEDPLSWAMALPIGKLGKLGKLAGADKLFGKFFTSGDKGKQLAVQKAMDARKDFFGSNPDPEILKMWEMVFASQYDITVGLMKALEKPGVFTRRSPSSVINMLRDNKTRTLFDTGTSAGLADTSVRSLAESKLFGQDNVGKMVYGYLVNTGLFKKMPEAADYLYNPFSPLTSQYGSVGMLLKPQTMEKVSLTAGDSLTEFMLNNNMDLLANGITKNTKKDISKKMTPDLLNKLGEAPYIEAQIPGFKPRSDIAAIYVKNKEDLQAIKDVVKELKLKIPVILKDGKAEKTFSETVDSIFKNKKGKTGTTAEEDIWTFANGGFVSGRGTSTSDSIPAMLSNGEFVVNAAAVSRLGVGFLNALNNPQGLSMPNFASSSAASNGSTSVVYLSPDDRALLRAVIDRPINLYTENAKIAQSANAGNVALAQRGKN